jgi:hypothetical protein
MYSWVIGNGTITAGAGTASITFTAGAIGTLTLNVTVTTAATCSDAKSASIPVTAAPPPVTVTSVAPNTGGQFGNTSVTIAGTGFLSGAGVTFGGSAATNVVVVNSTQITAKTPAHALGAVNVTVTNLNTTTGTLTNGYTYIHQQRFDPNGDATVDPSDIFYLVAYLFTGGPAPQGAAGMPSGDANNDGVVDPADIFYTVNYLFTGGPAPTASTSRVATDSVATPFAGSLILGTPVLRGDRYFVPVSIEMAPGSIVPQALSFKVRTTPAAGPLAVRRAGAAKNLQPSFEISRAAAGEVSYLVAFDQTNGGLVLRDRSAVVAEIELPAFTRGARIELDPTVTLLSDASGTRKATVSGGTLRLIGTTLERSPAKPEAPRPEVIR